MQVITIDDLVDYRILPFNIYNEEGEIVLNAGDNLTPGKLLQLRYLAALYCDENVITAHPVDSQDGPAQIPSPVFSDIIIDEEEDPFETTININSPINEQTQLQFKSLYKKAILNLNTKIDEDSVTQVKTIRDQLLDTILPVIEKTHKKSQLKIIGSYNKYHGLNVAILSTMLCKKMGLNDTQTADVALAALLHDIGKTRLPKEEQNSYSINAQQNKIYEIHPELGYKIIKSELKLPDIIARVALEHHEKNDGNGYPFGISGDLISQYSQIVSVCNMYDNLISGKAHVQVDTAQEAVKKMIEMGTSWFAPGILFSFVYMTNYYDNIPVEELGNMSNIKWK
ncbi:MAG: HD domain-containing protein [Candidatus Gastranaerophilales bacterium]|nr:HD domain-containing protein [Candidatus Gastranaerophilales bacterium]